MEARRLLTSYLVDSLADTIADDGMLTLREAIQASNTNVRVNEAAAGQSGLTAIDSVTFASTLSGGTISLSLGELMISDSLQISVGAAQTLTIDALGASRVLNVGAGVESFSQRGLTLSGGMADLGGGLLVGSGSRVSIVDVNVTGNIATGTGTTAGGGGIYNSGGELLILGGGLHVSGIATTSIDGGVISGNVAANEGGGLWNQAGSTMTILNGTLIQVNRALGNAANQGGGGIFNNGGTVNINNASIVSNFADGTSGSGDGLFNASGGTVSVTDTLIGQNVASRAGGGIEDASVTSGSATGNAITMTRVDLMQNNAGVITASSRGGALFSSPGNGGGLHVTGAANVIIVDTNVIGNVAANEGGGLWNSIGMLTVKGSTLSGNSAPDGGGIFNDSPAGDVQLTNSTLSGNRAARGAGIRSEGGNVSLTSVTIAANTAPVGWPDETVVNR